MADDRHRARSDFRRMIRLAVGAAVLMVAAAMTYLAATGDLSLHMIVATTLGVFFSVLLGAGLMAASYFSDKSGHDREVGDAARRDEPGRT